ncbi:MAG: FHA domain-containing protein [Planctomycetes bacterium]|nr:FHA domain-containing protein [Planctomycetota bacterium]
MANITLRVLDGADRGRVFANLPTPVTIGREEGNSVQLNDERISRFHLKIQEDQDKIVLTDLESTNGTKVNGENIQLRILRFGDIVHLGRSVLLFGSREEIADRLARLRGEQRVSGEGSPTSNPSLDFELNWTEHPNPHTTFQSIEPPELPQRMSPGQAAQLSELLEYLHIKLRDLISSGHPDPDESGRMSIEDRPWQAVADLQAQVVRYLRAIGEPPEE